MKCLVFSLKTLLSFRKFSSRTFFKTKAKLLYSNFVEIYYDLKKVIGFLQDHSSVIIVRKDVDNQVIYDTSLFLSVCSDGHQCHG